MNRILTCVAILLYLLLFAGCSNGNGQNTQHPFPPEGNLTNVLPPVPLPEYPVIDGSSSTVAMHVAIRTFLTGE